MPSPVLEPCIIPLEHELMQLIVSSHSPGRTHGQPPPALPTALPAYTIRHRRTLHVLHHSC